VELFQQVSFFNIYTCVYSICTIFTLLNPSLQSSSLHWYQLPRQDLFCLLVLWFCKRKKKCHYFLFKIALQGVSLWHFHVRMYYNPNWFISSILLLFTLVPFWWFQQV
jgi:hypothetical protein